MQRSWPQQTLSQQAMFAPAQENSVSEGTNSPVSYNFYETEGNEIVTSNSDSSSIADFWCVTQMNIIKFNFVWTISNFSSFQDEMNELKSSTFGSAPNDKLKWCLRINSRGLDDESRDYLSLYLLLVQCNKPDVRAKFKFSIFNADKEESKAMESQRAYRFVLGKDWGFKKFIRRDYLLDENNGLLPRDELTIFCEVSIVSDTVNLTGQNNILPLKIPNNTCDLADEIGSLIFDDQFADFKIKVNGTEIRTHKNILCARSPVFKAMLSHKGLAESSNDSVSIEDLDEETIRGMLHFIYSGKVPNLQSIAFKLLAAADKYEIKRLKALCEQSLYTSLSIQNACDILVHADLHVAEQLKAFCITYINQHAKAITQTEGYKSLSRELLDELYRAVVTNQHNQIPPIQMAPRKRARH